MKLNLSNQNYKRPFLIAGPCSVESEEQMLKVAQELKETCSPSLLRGGIWKPRTRPNSFEGVGEIGLPWLVNAGKETGIPVTTEVANAKHVELALKAGVDVLWLGARTTVNPFSVQEISDALKGVDITVMVKNPINPDLNLWLGAFERLQNSGIESLIGIHRGFSVYKHPKYRNAPNWEIPIGLMEEMPDLPIICDPSHISGRPEGLLRISQKAMDLKFFGLMIETHLNPEKAWSDAEQQITPTDLRGLLDKIVLRKMFTEKELSLLGNQRTKLTGLDDKIFELFSERMKIAQEIGQYKKENEIIILQTEQWKKIQEERLTKIDEYKLSKEFIRAILDAIHQESIRHQTKVMNPDSSHE